jgi:hypothetical protein
MPLRANLLRPSNVVATNDENYHAGKLPNRSSAMVDVVLNAQL